MTTAMTTAMDNESCESETMFTLFPVPFQFSHNLHFTFFLPSFFAFLLCFSSSSSASPQNDIQAQARCHRIGQTKPVNVYRLLTRNSYEQQMFQTASQKMGLDEVVLHNTNKDGMITEDTVEAMSADEMTKLLKQGVFGVLNDDPNDDSEDKNFAQMDIDDILGASKKIVHDEGGADSKAAGGIFSKVTFDTGVVGDVDVNDPDFWKKTYGEAKFQALTKEEELKAREKGKNSMNEAEMWKQVNENISGSDGDGDGDTGHRTLTGKKKKGGAGSASNSAAPSRQGSDDDYYDESSDTDTDSDADAEEAAAAVAATAGGAVVLLGPGAAAAAPVGGAPATHNFVGAGEINGRINGQINGQFLPAGGANIGGTNMMNVPGSLNLVQVPVAAAPGDKSMGGRLTGNGRQTSWKPIAKNKYERLISLMVSLGSPGVGGGSSSLYGKDRNMSFLLKKEVEKKGDGDKTATMMFRNMLLFFFVRSAKVAQRTRKANDKLKRDVMIDEAGRRAADEASFKGGDEEAVKAAYRVARQAAYDADANATDDQKTTAQKTTAQKTTATAMNLNDAANKDLEFVLELATVWSAHQHWAAPLVADIMEFGETEEGKEMVARKESKMASKDGKQATKLHKDAQKSFFENLMPQLEARGWSIGNGGFSWKPPPALAPGANFSSIKDAVDFAESCHPELRENFEQIRKVDADGKAREAAKASAKLTMTADSTNGVERPAATGRERKLQALADPQSAVRIVRDLYSWHAPKSLKKDQQFVDKVSESLPFVVRRLLSDICCCCALHNVNS